MDRKSKLGKQEGLVSVVGDHVTESMNWLDQWAEGKCGLGKYRIRDIDYTTAEACLAKVSGCIEQVLEVGVGAKGAKQTQRN